ncbi:MAG: fructosamine kinase family protein [Oleiphilaceae bacterium]|nr:fructosamine kinase family protein [Oleiphilaceae bacterium]
MWPKALQEWFAAQGYGRAPQRHAIGGGSISKAWRVTAPGKPPLFIKINTQAPEGFFAAEAEGLNYLHKMANVCVPAVRTLGDSFLVLEYIASGQAKADFWPTLARQLATLHQCVRGEFGFFNHNYCGSTVQNNTFCADGYAFFVHQRLWPLATEAHADALLAPGDLADLEKLIARLPQLIPPQSASLLHGDLWSGNVHTTEAGEPMFIDPAVYFAWPEIDLAMTQLFGGFPEVFYRAYLEANPLEPGWRERLPLYNLYPLLNHLVLFGGSYLSGVRRVLRQFA